MSFWKSKKDPQPEKAEPEKAEPEILDDWRECKGEWHEKELCHCGQSRTTYYPGNMGGYHLTYDVCPKCGHRDKWSKRVVRNVWEESGSRRDRETWERNRLPLYRSPDTTKFRRNETTEDWTPDHCPIKEDE